MAEQPIKKRVFGRRQGRPLNPSRKNVIDQILPEISITEETLTESGNFPAGEWFPCPEKPVWFEIGFGSGEHLSGIMRQDPECNYIGAEPFINGMAAFLKDIQDEPKDNIRVYMDDAMRLAKTMGDACLEGIYILNPDPWPKKRHHKRRIVSTENLNVFARIIKPGGKLIMATDVDELAEWMLYHSFRHSGFVWTAKNRSDWTNSPDGWIKTRYEQKGKEQGRSQTYLIFERKY